MGLDALEHPPTPRRGLGPRHMESDPLTTWGRRGWLNHREPRRPTGRDRMSTWGHCRFCKKVEFNGERLVRYAVRHSAHPACYLDAGKKLADLHPWQVGRFPYFLLKERRLLEEAGRILGERL